MTKCLIGITAALALNGCTHISRRPAATAPPKRPAPQTCADIFAQTFNPADLELAYELDQYVYKQVREYLAQRYEPWIKEFMSRAANQHDCETERDADQYAADINLKGARFSARVRQGSDPTTPQAILSNPAFNDAKTGVVLACYSECATRQMQATKPPTITCQKKCGATDLLANFYENSLALKRVAGFCFAGVTDANSAQKQQEFIGQYAKTLPPYLAKLATVQSGFQQELETDRRIVANLSRLKNEFQKFREARPKVKCGPPNYAWMPSVIAASAKATTLQDPGPQAKPRNQWQGSTFYTSGVSGRYLVTAAHVSEPVVDVNDVTRALMTVVNGPQANPEVIEFAVRPGLTDLGRDITLAREPRPGPALKLAGADEIPQAGQRFFVTGFPASNGGKFAVVRCTFTGFGPRTDDGNQKDTSYFLNCPGAPDIEGMSGGATVDEKGRVWGVNSASHGQMSSIIVSPLMMGAKGEPVTGVQKIFVSDLCYDPFIYEPYRCQVMPNMYEKDVP